MTLSLSSICKEVINASNPLPKPLKAFGHTEITSLASSKYTSAPFDLGSYVIMDCP